MEGGYGGDCLSLSLHVDEVRVLRVGIISVSAPFVCLPTVFPSLLELCQALLVA